MKRRRLDQHLVDLGLAENPTKARAVILAGLVFAGERRLDKPGQAVAPDLTVAVRGRPHPWVGRGGLKLAHALERFAIDPEGRICADIGASTGGFTDVLLAHGAARVYAVDVGHGQLAWKLRQDERVVVLDRTNARSLTEQQIPEPLDLIVCDVSFIGLKKALPASLALAAPTARLVSLIKPQFEVGRSRVGKGGIVRDPALHDEICAEIRKWLDGLPGWAVVDIIDSPNHRRGRQ